MGALLGAGLITILKQWLQDLLPKLLGQSGNFEVIVFGLVMIFVLHRARDGLWPVIMQRIERFLPSGDDSHQVEPAEALPRRDRPVGGDTILEVQQVTKRFGGLTANNSVSFTVRAGEVMALIGGERGRQRARCSTASRASIRRPRVKSVSSASVSTSCCRAKSRGAA